MWNWSHQTISCKPWGSLIVECRVSSLKSEYRVWKVEFEEKVESEKKVESEEKVESEKKVESEEKVESEKKVEFEEKSSLKPEEKWQEISGVRWDKASN